MENHDTHVNKNNDEDKTMATLSYLGFLCLVPLLMKKDNVYVQFHAKQGLIILIVWIVACFVNVIPILGQMVWSFVTAVLGVVSIIAIVKVWKNENWKIPYIYEYSKKVKI